MTIEAYHTRDGTVSIILFFIEAVLADQVSRNTLYQWTRLKEQTGSLNHQVKGQNASKLSSQKLAEYPQ